MVCKVYYTFEMIKKIALAIALVMIAYAGYYLFSPLFISVPVYDATPVSITAPTASTSIMTTDLQSYPVVGTVGHPAEGQVSIVTSSSDTFVRYESYKTINGPDLFVYLSKDLEATDFVNLGEIRGTEGDINYKIPDGVDVSEYPYVLTWCKQFGVLFNYAHVLPDSSDTETHTTTDAEEEHQTDRITESVATTLSTPILQTALFGNGCFWCAESDLEKVVGVKSVVSGYAGGTTEDPTYKNYIAGGHREVILVTYDPTVISYLNLVEHTIKHGDPTDATGSFNDRGPQYAPAIYYENQTEKAEALHVIAAVDAMNVFDTPLPILVLPTVQFWPAEEYHQDYARKNPLKYSYYRTGSGRTAFIEKTWGDRASQFEVPPLPQGTPTVLKEASLPVTAFTAMSWNNFQKPSADVLKKKLTPTQYEVTQEEGTESPFNNEYDKEYREGIYVDIVSGEPLFFSKDKYDSGTGWPSFVQPMSDDVLTLHVDKKLFSTRTEVRSRHADSHLGHVFDDGPDDRGGKRYCMNSAALRFIAKADMEREGYGYVIPLMGT